MMLYTRKGDGGTTKTLSSEDRFSKSSPITDALGTVDELNAFLGLCKVESGVVVLELSKGKQTLSSIVDTVQKNLFIVQAELAGADMKIAKRKITEMEKIVDAIEKKLPPITSFLIPGASKLGSLFDIARTITRRAERKMVALGDLPIEEGGQKDLVSKHTLSYINRLSSLMYALTRYVNHLEGGDESAPDYL